MGIAVLIALALVMLFTQAWLRASEKPERRRITVWRRTRRVPAGTAAAEPAADADEPGTPTESASDVVPLTFQTSPDEIERTLTARLLSGHLDRAEYHEAMDALMSVVKRAPTAATVPRMLAVLGTPPHCGELLGRLGVALPELPPETVFAAFNLARCGANVDELVRLMDLTEPQALRISTVVSGADGRRD